MKIQILILSILLNSLSAIAHDVPLALFGIAESEGLIQLHITFELEDFSKSAGIKEEEVNLESVEDYLNRNTSFQFNTQLAAIKITDIQIVRGHIRIKGNLGMLIENIKSIQIKNTCLNDIHNHSNVIQVDLNSTSKDYRMHKERTAINLTY